jgi:LmbE family N-acetylglucosaminyl deacetylase
MIDPLVSESEWVHALDTLTDWDPPPEKPMLVVAPHPDDETLGAGGLIAFQAARGVPITVAAVTDGERAYPDEIGLAELRRQEQRKALARLGVPGESIVRLALPDGNVAAFEDELVQRLGDLVQGHTHIVASWRGDFHGDHEACGRAAEEIALRKGATLTSYFFWAWHFGTVALLKELRLARFRLSADLLKAKTEALKSHRSQLASKNGDPVLPERLLLPARRPFEVFVTR